MVGKTQVLAYLVPHEPFMRMYDSSFSLFSASWTAYEEVRFKN